MIVRLLRSIGFAGLVSLGIAVSTPAYADQVAVTRHVTLRDAPSRDAAIVSFPDLGTTFVLLDDGTTVRGYYHVRFANDKAAWIYSTFVERRPDAPQVAAVPSAASAAMAVHYIDVDQGASALLEFSCGAVLIDAGGRGDAASDHLVAYLNAFFARRPDLKNTLAAIFVTHTHIDHNTNLKRVVQLFHVSNYIHNGVLTGSGRAAANWMVGYAPTATPAINTLGVTEPMVVAAGTDGLTNASIDPVKCSGTDPAIHVLSGSYATNPGWPDGELENGNNQSLVIRVDYGMSSFLFTGDMEEPAIETLVTRYAGTRTLDVDVYAVGHHGSYNGTTKSLLDAMTPKIAVMSMGHSNIQLPWTAWAYGHPRKAAVDMLVAGVSDVRAAPTTVLVADKVKSFFSYPLTRAVYATGWDGDVTIDATSAGEYTVEIGK